MLIKHGCQINEIRQYEQQLLLKINHQEKNEVIENLENVISSYSPLKEKNNILYEDILPPINEAVALHEETIDAKLEISKEEVKEMKFLQEENDTQITYWKDKKEDDTNKNEAKMTFIKAEIEEKEKVKNVPILTGGEVSVRPEEGCQFCQSCFIY